jgi:putative ABC transport system substrate-binding protein
MKRREFVGLIGGAAGWPLAARAQQPALPMIGFLRSTSLADATHLVTAFRQGLEGTGFVEGQNVAIEFRSAGGANDMLPPLVADLIRRPVNVIVGNDIAARTAKAATYVIPIVFGTGSDPVKDGLVASLNRPGANVTGVSFLSGVIGAKRLDLLRQLVPNVATIAMLANPTSSEGVEERNDVESATQAAGLHLIAIDVSKDGDIDTALTTFVQRGVGALLVGSGAFLNSNRDRIVALAEHHALPTAYSVREAATAGGLMSYGTSLTDAYRQIGIYAGRILKGEKPSEMPVVRSAKLELVINLNAARKLSLEIPPSLLARADEVIE